MSVRTAMTPDEAVVYLRQHPRYAGLVHNAYLGEDVLESAERFLSSGEFAEVQRLLGDRVPQGRMLDLGAGNGIASYAFAKCGANLVYALEPSPSQEVGRGAVCRLSTGLPIQVIDAVAEQIPLRDGEVDVVYGRQVLHHTRDLFLAVRECARVLRRGGVFLACREHVVDNEHQLEVFLNNHPLHKLAGGENAFPLRTYLNAVNSAGLELKQVFGPWDTVINASPTVRTTAELERFPLTLLKRRFGSIGSVVGLLPGVKSLVWAWLKQPRPGRPYSFLAIKPE